MFRRLLAGAASAVLATTVLTACSPAPENTPSAACVPKHTFPTLKKGVLTVSTYALPPFSVLRNQELTPDGVPIGDDGTLEGVDGDILAEIAANECLTLEINSTAAAAVLSTVRAGGADVGAANWYRTVERAKILDLTDPIYTDQLAIISADGTTDFSQLKGRRVATVLGYQYVADLRDYFGEGLVLFNSPLTMFNELKRGNIDAAIDTVGVGAEFVRDTALRVETAKPNEAIAASLEPGQSAFLVQQGKAELLAALNANIKELRTNGRLAEILEKYGLDPSAAEPGEPRLLG